MGAIRQAVEQENWYAALAVALAVPDICGRLDGSGETSKTRYIEWFDKWMAPRYDVKPLPLESSDYKHLSGADCYALRCSYLHAGSDEIDDTKIKESICAFHFIEPLEGDLVHNNKLGLAMQLQVDIFCLDIVDAVERWLKEQPDDFPDATAELLTVWPHPFA